MNIAEVRIEVCEDNDGVFYRAMFEPQRQGSTTADPRHPCSPAGEWMRTPEAATDSLFRITPSVEIMKRFDLRFTAILTSDVARICPSCGVPSVESQGDECPRGCREPGVGGSL